MWRCYTRSSRAGFKVDYFTFGLTRLSDLVERVELEISRSGRLTFVIGQSEPFPESLMCLSDLDVIISNLAFPLSHLVHSAIYVRTTVGFLACVQWVTPTGWAGATTVRAVCNGRLRVRIVLDPNQWVPRVPIGFSLCYFSG